MIEANVSRAADEADALSDILDTPLPPPEPSPFDGVLEGGGVKGIGHVGAYAVLYERGFRCRNLAGTSAGPIVATLIAAGTIRRRN